MKDLKVFFRCHPDTPSQELRALPNKENLVLWVHGGKFSPSETAVLVNKSADAGLKTALDIGQKTRVQKIDGAEDINSSGLGKWIAVDSTILLVSPEVFDLKLNEFKEKWSSSIIAKVNRLPQIDSEFGPETKISFGENEVICQIDQKNSKKDSHIFLTVLETKLGKVFSDHGIVGGTYSLEESRDDLLSDRDINCLKQNSSASVDYLILSFVTNKEALAKALKQIDQIWPGWIKNKKHKIILKIETASAVENITELFTLDKGNFIYMVGLGDLSVSVNYKKWALDKVVNDLLEQFDSQNKQVILSTGICVPMLPPDSYEVLDWSPQKLAWLDDLVTRHPSIFAIGTTSESIRASQRGILGSFLNKVRLFS